MAMQNLQRTYFNELKVDLNNPAFFSPHIHERTKENPNSKVSVPCKPHNGSLDEYAGKLTSGILSALR